MVCSPAWETNGRWPDFEWWRTVDQWTAARDDQIAGDMGIMGHELGTGLEEEPKRSVWMCSPAAGRRGTSWILAGGGRLDSAGQASSCGGEPVDLQGQEAAPWTRFVDADLLVVLVYPEGRWRQRIDDCNGRARFRQLGRRSCAGVARRRGRLGHMVSRTLAFIGCRVEPGVARTPRSGAGHGHGSAWPG
jgi:hypothetical protein